MLAPHLHVTDGMSDHLVSLVTLIYCFVPLKALNLKLSTFDVYSPMNNPFTYNLQR